MNQSTPQLKNAPPRRLARASLLTVILAAGLQGFVTAQEEEGPQVTIGARPLTHQEIADRDLPEGTQPAGGLFTVGTGQPVYLEAYVPPGTPVDEAGVAWAITARPDGSTVELEESPLGPEVPIYEPSNREFYSLAGRIMLRPDMVGQYTVEVTVSTPDGDLVASHNVVGAHYVGVGKPGVFNPSGPQCALCHDDKYLTWKDTGHASMFTEAIDGLKSSHYNEECIQCHTVGFDTNPLADNGGFDDVARLTGWMFPETLEPGNWEAVPEELKNVSNIQCENCHGAGSAHTMAGGNPEFISLNYSSGDCAQCHDEKPYHVKNQEWNNSLHAIATRSPTGEGRESCVRCHSGIGFIETVDGVSTAEINPDYAPINCAACHDPHSAENPHQLRKVDGVELMNGTMVTSGGNGRICMNCHISRRNAEEYATEYHSHYGPHHGPQTDMLAGTNAIEYDRHIPSSAHLFAVADTCATCHLQETAMDSEVHLQAGGHTFKPSWDGGTPDDPSDDVDLVGACQNCHGPIESFDFARQDYDDDGEIEGVQTEIEGLLHRLALLLPPLGDPAVDVTEAYSAKELKAAYNYLFVEEDGSMGVHNLSYAVGILRASLADLTGDGTIVGDADDDCLPDEWEIEYFGSTTAQNASGDADGDGLTNGMELAAGTLPNQADSDGDGFSDFEELHTGTNPLDMEDNPEVGRSEIYRAAELVFLTEVGKTYQVQMVDELSNGGGGWTNVGEPIEGNGGMIQHFISTRDTSKEFYRIIEVSP